VSSCLPLFLDPVLPYPRPETLRVVNTLFGASEQLTQSQLRFTVFSGAAKRFRAGFMCFKFVLRVVLNELFKDRYIFCHTKPARSIGNYIVSIYFKIVLFTVLLFSKSDCLLVLCSIYSHVPSTSTKSVHSYE
jgi:hypothetical protein